MPDYTKGKIYTIRCRTDDTLIYVGSTIQPLSVRFGGHKKASRQINCQNMLIYKTINHNWDDWYIELYEENSCENKEQLGKREGEVIRSIGTLNSRIEGRTKKEYYEDNTNKILEQKKQYRGDNKDKILEQKKQYYEIHKDKILEQKKNHYNNKKKITQSLPERIEHC
jgi:hypothetical protein